MSPPPAPGPLQLARQGSLHLQSSSPLSGPQSGTLQNKLAEASPEAPLTLHPCWPPLCRYAKDGVLLPTVSNRVRTSPAEIEEYFSNFLTLQPQGKIDHSNVRLLAEDTAINSGVYTFDLVKDGKPTKVQARYSFTYKRLEDGQWYIVDHHSSGMPEAVVDNDLDDVAKQFDRWNAALQTLDPIQVAAL